MKFGIILLLFAIGAVLAPAALADVSGVTCGTPTHTGTVQIVLTDGNGYSETFSIVFTTISGVTDEDKAQAIKDEINNTSSVFSAGVTGGDPTTVGFTCGSPAVAVPGCNFISGTDEGLDLYKVSNQPSGGGTLIVTLSGTPAQSGWVAVGITGTYVASTSTASKPTAAGILVVLRDLLIGHSISASINGSGQLEVPYPQGTTSLSFGDTDAGLTIGADHDE